MAYNLTDEELAALSPTTMTTTRCRTTGTGATCPEEQNRVACC